MIISRVRLSTLAFAKKAFVRNVAAVASGAIAAQVIVIAASPLITRLYGPEAYGIFGIFIAIVALFSPISTLTYSTAIVLPKSNMEAGGITKVSVISAMLLSLLMALVIILFKDGIVQVFELETVSRFLWLIPVILLLIAGTQILNQWLIRTGKFKKHAIITVAKALVVNGSKVGAGFVYATASVLILVAALGYFLHTILLYAGVSRIFSFNNQLKKNQPNLKQDLSENFSLSDLARKYNNFPLYRAPQVLFGAITKAMPLLLLAHFFGPAAAGFFAIGNRVLNLPASIIGKSIGNVYYPRIAEAANNQESIRPYFIKATLGMGGLAFLPLLFVAVFGPSLFQFVFGHEWIIAGYYARWLSILVFFEFILHPGKDALIVRGQQKVLLGFEILSLLFKTSMLLAGFYFFNNDLIALFLFSMASVVLSLGLLSFIAATQGESRYSTG